MYIPPEEFEPVFDDESEKFFALTICVIAAIAFCISLLFFLFYSLPAVSRGYIQTEYGIREMTDDLFVELIVLRLVDLAILTAIFLFFLRLYKKH